MTRLRWAALLGVAAGTAGIGWFLVAGTARDPLAPARDFEPLGRTVTVEVWNGGGSPGAARDAALRLRRGGLDVVNWENAPVALRDSTTRVVRILVRGGDTLGSGRIAEVLGPTEVIDAPDPTRLVDLTIIVPRDSG